MLIRSALIMLLAVLVAATIIAAPAQAAVKGPVDLGGWNIPAKISGWQFSDPNHVAFVKRAGEPVYLHVVSPPGADNQNGRYLLPLKKVRGSVVELTVEIRAAGVTKPAAPYNGVKAMIHVQSRAGADTWDQADANGSTFPVTYNWRPAHLQTTIPATCSAATIVLGLQDSSGTVDFRNLRLNVIRTIVLPPARHVAGPVYTGHGSGALRGVMISPDIRPDDVATLKEWRVNLVRWQLRWNGYPGNPADTADAAAYDAWLDGALHHLDQMMPIFREAGIKVVLDMHTPPGGSDPDGTMRLFRSVAWQTHMTQTWERMANRYRGNPTIWGYDLLNEPVEGTLSGGARDWDELAEQTAERIRRIDKVHAIIVEPAPWANVDSLAYFAPLHVSGVVYSIHFYEPHAFTHQGVLNGLAVGPVYPGVIDGAEWNRTRIRESLQPAADYANRFHVHIYLGEFSAVRWANGSDRYISDVIDFADAHHWDWTYHAFREWQGWSPEIGSDKDDTNPSPTPTARLQVLKAAFAKNM